MELEDGWLWGEAIDREVFAHQDTDEWKAAREKEFEEIWPELAKLKKSEQDS